MRTGIAAGKIAGSPKGVGLDGAETALVDPGMR